MRTQTTVRAVIVSERGANRRWRIASTTPVRDRRD